MQTDQQHNDERFQILAVCLACLPMVSFGMQFCWPSPAIPKILENEKIYGITLDEASYFAVLPAIAIIISCILFNNLPNIIGRKYTLLLSSIPYSIGWILTACAKSLTLFYVARFIFGIGDALAWSALSMYLGEVSTPRVRGVWGNAMTWLVFVGMVLMNIVGTYLDLATSAWISLAFPILFLITFAWMPETPYFYMMKGRENDAIKSLQKLKRREDVQDDLESIRRYVSEQLSYSSKWCDLLFVERNRKAIIAGIWLRAGQQYAGISALITLSQYVFQKAGSNLPRGLASIIVSIVLLIFTSSTFLTVRYLGRRQSLILSTIACIFANLLLAIYLYLDEFGIVDLSGYKWVPVVLIVFFCIVYSLGLATLPNVMMSELFPVNVKQKCMCVMIVIFAITTGSSSKLLIVLDQAFGIYSPFALFAICCAVSVVAIYLFVPETKDKTLEEIHSTKNDFENKAKS